MSEDIISEVEELFSPKPGGMIDRHRKEKARREEAARERENADEPVEQAAYKSVKVTQLAPEVVAINILLIQPLGYSQVLPYSPYRYHATILGVKGIGTGTVVLAKDSNQALGGIGYPLPPGIPQPYLSRAQLYAYNPDAVNTVQVAVIAEIYGPETI